MLADLKYVHLPLATTRRQASLLDQAEGVGEDQVDRVGAASGLPHAIIYLASQVTKAPTLALYAHSVSHIVSMITFTREVVRITTKEEGVSLRV